MPSDAFSDRARSFEEGYFRNKDAELVDKLRKVFETTRTKEELSKATGITNPEALERLVAINLRGELMTVFKLFPLVEVAWADGSIDQSEADTVIAAAIKMGVPKDGEAIARLKYWLYSGPKDEGRAAWRMYAAELRKSLNPTELATFRNDLLKVAKDVAEASGGILGAFLQVSGNEHKVIENIKKALTHE